MRDQGDHNWSAWTDKLRVGVPMLWRHCFECIREEWEFEETDTVDPEPRDPFLYAKFYQGGEEPSD